MGTWARAVPRPCGALEPESSSPKSTPSTPSRQPWKVGTEAEQEFGILTGSLQVSVEQ